MREINDLTEQSGPQVEVQTFDYKDALAELETVYQERWRDYRMTLSPLGSKLQALGISLFHQLHPDVRVIFSVSKRYNAKNYSEGSKGLWQIDFGSLPELCEILNQLGTLVIEDGPTLGYEQP